MVISADRPHGPEAGDLEHGRNGLIVEDGNDARRYAAAVTDLLGCPELRERLAAGCRESAGEYTLEDMVAGSAEGLELALGRISPQRPGLAPEISEADAFEDRPMTYAPCRRPSAERSVTRGEGWSR